MSGSSLARRFARRSWAGLDGPGLNGGLDTAAGCCRMVGLAEVVCTSRAAGIFYSLVGQFARVPVPWGVSGLRVAAVAFVQSLRRKRKRMAIEDRRLCCRRPLDGEEG